MLLIKNGYIKTMAGKDIKNGCILVNDDGKIEKVGKKIDAPDNCEIIDAEGRLVTPGCIDAHTHIGIIGCNENVDPLTPQLRAIDNINPTDYDFADALKGGVTAACTGPGSANVVGGTFAAIKLYGKNVDKMVIKQPIAMKCAFGENPKKVYGGKGKSPFSRMGTAAVMREFLFKAKKYAEDDAAGKPHAFDMKLEAMIPVMRKELPLKAHMHQADDILTAIRIAKEFDLKMTLDHCTDGSSIAEEVAASGFPALVGPLLGNKSKVELLGKSFKTPGILNKAGVKICIVTDCNVLPIDVLPLCAGLAVSEGLDYEEGWKAITINPAEIAGIADRVGSLEKGKDADIVIWTHDPLTSVQARSYVTLVDGKVVYSNCK